MGMGMASTPVTLLALATAVPPHQLEQSEVADFARRIYAKSFARYPKLADVSVSYTHLTLPTIYSV